MLPKILQPISCEDLTRVGANHDGGYVLSKRIIDNAETILTFGLADEFSFEINFIKLKKNIKIFAFDHTVDRLYWVKHFVKWSWWAIRYRKSFGRAFTFLKYKSFFNNKEAFHFVKKIVPTNEESDGNISITQILQKFQINDKKTLLKVDIDMDEYKILDEILNYDFTGLIIEFSYVDKMLKNVIEFVEKNKKMSIVHIHGNNFDQPDKNGDPIHLEVTFLRNELLNENEKKKSFKEYPLKDLDYPNNTMKSDIPIKFLDN